MVVIQWLLVLTNLLYLIYFDATNFAISSVVSCFNIFKNSELFVSIFSMINTKIHSNFLKIHSIIIISKTNNMYNIT